MTTPSPPTILLSFDLEDWEQVEGARLGHPALDRPRPGFIRRMQAVFDLLDELKGHATFFVLGQTIRHYPEVIQEIVRRGDEVGCHGFDHEPVYRRNIEHFRTDIQRCLDEISRAGAPPPGGFRAPSFSITRTTPWALGIIAELGFVYDSSLYDTPRVPDRIRGLPEHPFRLVLPNGGDSLWEIPPAVVSGLPIGGGAYWRALPGPMLRVAMDRWGAPHLPLYFHPHECDPLDLKVPLPSSASAATRIRARRLDLQFGLGRRRVIPRIRRLLTGKRVITYQEGLAELIAAERPPSLSLGPDGALRA